MKFNWQNFLLETILFTLFNKNLGVIYFLIGIAIYVSEKSDN